MSDQGYKKLENQPLKFVLAEFQFSPVLQMAEYIPKLHERLRDVYPMMQTRSDQSVQVSPGGIEVTSLPSWSFVSANKRNALDINQERIVFCTSDYPRFEGFSGYCRTALETLQEIIKPALLIRIGLRYGDLITLSEQEKMTDLVDGHFIVPETISDLGSNAQRRGEIFFRTESGTLAIRTIYGHHNLSVMPDIKGMPVIIDDEHIPGERMLLDFDHSWEDPVNPHNFNVDSILDRLEALHNVSREAFWKVTTDYARNQKWS